MEILNLTQHPASPAQIEAGLVDPKDHDGLRELLTFSAADLAANPSAAPEHVAARAREIVARYVLPHLAESVRRAMRDCMDPLLADEYFLQLAAGGFDHDIKAMIGGAPYLMAPLERELRRWRVTPLYSLSERVSEERQFPDGSVVKTQVHKHLGFLEVR